MQLLVANHRTLFGAVAVREFNKLFELRRILLATTALVERFVLNVFFWARVGFVGLLSLLEDCVLSNVFPVLPVVDRRRCALGRIIFQNLLIIDDITGRLLRGAFITICGLDIVSSNLVFEFISIVIDGAFLLVDILAGGSIGFLGQ